MDDEIEARVVRVPVRGQEVAFVVGAPGVGEIDSQIDMLTCALLALEDPRVDAVLRAFGFQIVDDTGATILDLGDPV